MTPARWCARAGAREDAGMTSRRLALTESIRDRWFRALHAGRQPRIVRASLRFSVCWGGLGAGGVTFAAMISLTAGLTILVSLARAFLGDRPELIALIIDIVNDVVPALINDGTNNGLIPAATLIRAPGWSLTALVSTVVVLWGAATMMTGLRRTVRQMFGLDGAPLPFAKGKAIDLAAFLALSVAIIVSSALVSAVTFLSEQVLHWLSVDETFSYVLLQIAAVLLAGALDALLVSLIFRFTARVRVPRRDLIQGMIIGAVGLGALRLGGTSVIGLSDNPLLASAAAVGTLLVWINLAMRWLLFTAAWTANPPPAHVPVHPATVYASQTPNYVTMSAPHTLEWAHHPVTGTIIPKPTDPRFARDRAALAAATGSSTANPAEPAERIEPSTGTAGPSA